MQPLLTTLPTLAVSILFCLWHKYHEVRMQRKRRLHERVAYMLWVMVNGAGSEEVARVEA